MSFEAMPGDDRTRFCPACDKNVHDLSARTEPEARAFLAAARGSRLCVRYAKDASGSIRFRVLAVAAAVSLSGCAAPLAHVPAAPVGAPSPASAEGDYDMGDGIMDVEDVCPDEPGPDDAGCPETA